MDEWTAIQALTVIVGLFIAVGAPIIKLNGTIVKLNANVEILDKRFGKFEDENKDSHKRLWSKNMEQDAVLNNHEGRLRELKKIRQEE